MESFVDRIIETDRKAREIIQQAQEKKEIIKTKTEDAAKKALAEREAMQKEKMLAQDTALAKREAQAMEKADRDYIVAKHKLDATFDAGLDKWEDEIVACVINVK